MNIPTKYKIRAAQFALGACIGYYTAFAIYFILYALHLVK